MSTVPHGIMRASRRTSTRAIRRSRSEKTWMLSALVLAVGCFLLDVPGAVHAAHGSEKSSSIAQQQQQQLKDPSAPLPDTCSLSGDCEPCPADELETTVCKATGYRQRYSCYNGDSKKDSDSTDDDGHDGNSGDEIVERREKRERNDDKRRDRTLVQQQQKQKQQQLYGLYLRGRALSSEARRRDQTIVFRSCVSPAAEDQRAVIQFETMMVMIAVVCLTVAQRRNNKHRQKLSKAVNPT